MLRRWIGDHRDAWRAAFQRDRHRGGQTATLVVLLGVLLAIPGWLAHAVFTMQSLTPATSERSEVLVFLSDALDLEARVSLERSLGADARIAVVQFVPKAAALAELASQDGLASIAALGDQNPLPDAYRLTLPDAGSPQGERQLVESLSADDGVLAVRYFPSIQTRLADVVTILSGIVIALAGLTAVGVAMAVFVVSGAEAFRDDRRLQLYTLLGASRRYIRRPYLYRATLQGAVAGLVASLVVWGINTVLSSAFSAELQTLGAHGEALAFRWEVWAALVGVAVGCSWVGAERAIAMRLNRMH